MSRLATTALILVSATFTTAQVTVTKNNLEWACQNTDEILYCCDNPYYGPGGAAYPYRDFHHCDPIKDSDGKIINKSHSSPLRSCLEIWRMTAVENFKLANFWNFFFKTKIVSACDLKSSCSRIPVCGDYSEIGVPLDPVQGHYLQEVLETLGHEEWLVCNES